MCANPNHTNDSRIEQIRKQLTLDAESLQLLRAYMPAFPYTSLGQSFTMIERMIGSTADLLTALETAQAENARLRANQHRMAEIYSYYLDDRYQDDLTATFTEWLATSAYGAEIDKFASAAFAIADNDAITGGAQ